MTNAEIVEHIGAEALRRASRNRAAQVAYASVATVAGIVKLFNAREELPGVVRIATPAGWRCLRVDPSMVDGEVRFVSEYEALRNALDEHVAAQAKVHGLVLAGELRASKIAVPQRGGDRVIKSCEDCRWPIGDYKGGIGDYSGERMVHWIDVELDERKILETATMMIESIAAKHGPGNLWPFGGAPVHIINDDGHWKHRDPYADRILVRLRALHAHESYAAAFERNKGLLQEWHDELAQNQYRCVSCSIEQNAKHPSTRFVSGVPACPRCSGAMISVLELSST